MRARWIWILTLIQMIVVLILIFTATSKADQPTQPEAAINTAQTEIIVFEYTPEKKTERVQKPETQIFSYPIDQETIEKYARAFWGLNTSKEKFAFAGVAVHRALCTEKYADGSFRFESETFNRLSGVITNGEFAFYREDAPASEDNKHLAETYINIHLTMILTKQYTGYIFPSWALYMDWTDNGQCVVYDRIGGSEFYVG